MPPSSDAPPSRWAQWMRALWGERAQVEWQHSGDGHRPMLSGRPHPVIPAEAGMQGVRSRRLEAMPWIPASAGMTEEDTVHLPSSTEDRTAFAACAHAAAHFRFGGPPQARAGLKPVQQALHAVLEDARIEALALRELPGLRALWLPFHTGPDAPQGNHFEALLARLARSLLERASDDPHPWVRRARGEFLAAAPADGAAVRALASRLGNDIGQMRLPFNPRTWRVHAAYRDDGSWLWQPEAAAPASETTLAASADEVPAGTSQQAAVPIALEPVTYPEWDARIGRYRADWCRVYTLPAQVAPARLAVRDETGAGRRLGRALASLRGGLARWDGLATAGEELHPMAMVDARLQRLAGHAPQQRVWRRRVAPPERLAVQLLLDASASTAERAANGASVLENLLAVALACAAGLESAGHQVAILGFASRTRERIEVRPLKDWSEASTDRQVRARCAGLASGGSTRLGAALRHATERALAAPHAARAVVLVLTDGDLHDVDTPDPAYLPGDLRRAVAEAERAGIAVRGLLWQGDAPAAIGALRHARIRSPAALPQLLPTLLAT